MIGEILNGYDIKEFIDSGSFGSVYKAEKNGLFFAIKAFNADYVFKEYREHGSNNRIDREIAIMRSLNHMNLVRYEEDFYLEYKNVKYYFLVMEYIDGTTLQKHIDSNGKLEKDEIIPIFRQILEGVRALHNIYGNDHTKGIIHRDLKPQNIMITHDGIVKILDYGISKVIDFTTITSTGDFLGSPIYSSPEQIINSKNIDKRSDLYTLGVILYYAITKELPYNFSNQGELINQIVKESPIPPRQKDFKIDNKIENIILKLLEKEPYRRYENIDRLIELVENIDKEQLEIKTYDLSKKFYALLYNDKTVLEKYIQQFPNKKTSVIFPANHQFQQKNLLKLCQSVDFSMIVDPATIRLTYSSYAEVQGLKNLPYSPQGLQPISPTNLGTLEKQQIYTKSVLDEELRLNADILISPFHYPHNSSTISTFDRNTIKEWFDLDIKLLKESINYRDEFFPEKQLYAGVCLNGESLNDERYRNDIMNIFSSFDCDGYLIYVDGIDKDSSAPTIYNYVKTLRDLQHYTQKPVIASRIDVLGLGLLCVGISGFASGIARFESFYEGLYTDEQDAYNMYERYYFPQLLGTVPVKRDTPTTFEPIVQKLGACMCSFCSGKTPLETIKSPVNKLHYLELIDGEITKINNLGESIRIQYFLGRIEEAINNYKMLSKEGLFREKNYKHLEVWKVVFNQLLKDQNV